MTAVAQERTALWSSLDRVRARAVILFRALWMVNAAAVTIAALVGLDSTQGAATAAVAMVWAAAVIVVVWRTGRVPRFVAVADVAVFTAFLVLAPTHVPAQFVGDGTTWLGTGASVSILVAAWVLSAPASVVATVVVVLGYLVGLSLLGEAATGGPPLSGNDLMTAVQLSFHGVVGMASLLVMRAATRAADDTLVRRTATEKVAYVEQSVEDRALEQRKVLHDHVSNTLWLLADYLTGATARARAAEAVHHLRELEADRTPAWGGTGLVAAVREVVAAATVRVDLHVVSRPAPTFLRRRRAVDGPEPHDPPAVVVGAVAAAVREALSNVARHAGADHATVQVEQGRGSLTVTVRDNGHGFDPANPGEGLGIRQSIVDSMTRVGGTAQVSSARHSGTTWVLAWSGGRRLPPSVVVREAVRDRYQRGFLAVYALIALGFHAFVLVYVLTRRQDYVVPGLAIACWIAVAFASAVLLGGIGRRWMSSGLARSALLAIIVASTVLVLNCQPWGVVSHANWGIGEVGWFIVLASIYLRLAEVLALWLAAAALNVAAVLSITDDPWVLVKLAGIVVGYSVLQAATLISFATMRAETARAADNAWHAHQLLADRDVAKAAKDHAARLLATVDRRTRDLLESIADGRLDPADPVVAERCRDAARLMRLCGVLRAKGALDLVPVVTGLIDRGTHPTLSVADGFDAVPAAPRAAIVALLQDVLPFVQPGESVLAVQNDVALAGSFGRPVAAAGAVSVSMTVPITSGRGPELRGAIAPPPGLDVEIDLYDADGNPDDAAATSAWISMAYRP